VLADVRQTLEPALSFDKEHESLYKSFKAELPKHKMKYNADGQIVLRFDDKPALADAQTALRERGIETALADAWAYRPITRDIPWGIPVGQADPELLGKTLYVWPDSLLAPISFSKVALKNRGEDPARVDEFWRDPGAQVFQFLGQDNIFFYTLLQGGMWLAMQDDPHRLPVAGELTLTDVFGCYHLLLSGEKLSKSTGNFVTGDDLLERGYSADQVRYYLSLLGLPEKRSDFEFGKFDERNDFLAGPLNAAFEKPQSAARSKFDGRVPEGQLVDKIQDDTARMVQRYVTAMNKAAYPSMLFELENYARKINSLFARYKPHDDRHPESERRDALYSCFFVLKNLMIMLYPFVPETMDRLRSSLNLPKSVLSVDQLGTGIDAGHELGEQVPYFPETERTLQKRAQSDG
jgi:methionyl-tRNA synthetase